MWRLFWQCMCHAAIPTRPTLYPAPIPLPAARPPQRAKAKTSHYQHLTGCGLVPCQSGQLQRAPTLVVYVYAAGGCCPNLDV